MYERVSWQYITCQCGLCKSLHEECGPTHRLVPVHTFHTTHWELNCTKSCALLYKDLKSSVSLHMSVITQNGDSAVMMAFREGMIEVFSLLLKAEANINLQNRVHVSVHVQVVWEEMS